MSGSTPARCLALLALVAASACESSRQGTTRVVDLGHVEGNVWTGLLGFSSDYDADPQLSGGVLARAPSPLLSRDLLGMRRDDLGLYLQAGAGSIDRDLDTLDETQGAVLLGTLGIDYTLIRDDSWLLLAQAGLQYVGIKDVAAADDGVGFVLGGLGGLALNDRLWITLNPQFIQGDGAYLYLVSLGLHVAF